MFRFSREAFAQFWILGRDPDRAGVQVALAHHQAALDDQGGGGKAEFVCAEKCRNNDIATGTQTAIGLYRDASSKIIQGQRLLGFGQSDLPWEPGVLDRRDWAGPGSTIISGNGHVIRVSFGYPCGHRADTNFRHQFDADSGFWIDVLEIVDQLCQVLDRIDVMVRWRGNQSHARSRVTDLGNDMIHLMTRQLASFTGFCALGDLDLDIVGVDQVFGGYAETPGSDLLDCRTHGVSIFHGLESL